MLDIRDRIACQHTHRTLIEKMQSLSKDKRILAQRSPGDSGAVEKTAYASEPLNPLFKEAACLAAAIQRGCM